MPCIQATTETKSADASTCLHTSAVVMSCGADISTSSPEAVSASAKRRGLWMAEVAAEAALQQEAVSSIWLA